MYAIANATIIPLRQQPDEGSEQLTQLLWGENCEVLERLPRWTRVRSLLDGQEGWGDFKMFTLSDKAPTTPIPTAVVCVPCAYCEDCLTGERTLLTMGTRLPEYEEGTFLLLDRRYRIAPQHVASSPLPFTPENILRLTQSLLNTPYLWGGKSALGIDCSGLTQVVYSVFGVNLLRNAREQITQGQPVNSLDQAQTGDLVFFDHADRDPQATNISHVGLLLSPTEVVHCSGKVHVNNIDAHGIYLPSGERTHHLVGIRRYMPRFL